MPKKLTTEQWIEKAIAVHGDVYDYTQVVYVSAHDIVEIICTTHGMFPQKAYSHLNGKGCPDCGKEKLHNPRIGKKEGKSPQEVFLKRAEAVHGDKYDYSLAIYKHTHKKLTVVCRNHGPFEVTPKNHTQKKSGCKTCYHESVSERQFLSQEEFLEAAKEVHGDTYDYSNAVYTRATDNIVIGCKTHGDFLQLATVHIHQGSGCPSCTHRVSNAEREVGDFLESLGENVIRNDFETLKPLLGRAELDIVLPDHGLAIEYCGLIWHSDKFKSTKNRHLRKHKACEELGLRLITIFEDEWIHQRDIVESFFKHLLGKSPRGCMARKSEIREIHWRQSKEFLDKHHFLSSGSPAKYRVGAFNQEDNLIGVMTFGTPSDERGKTGTIEMKRFVTDKSNHPGLGSKMFKWAQNTWDFQEVLAFVDRRWFQGKFKMISGFEQEGETEPTVWWTNGRQRLKRRAFTKSELKKMDRFKNTDLSKRAMLAELGWYRLWDCGKLRMVWKKQPS